MRVVTAFILSLAVMCNTGALWSLPSAAQPETAPETIEVVAKRKVKPGRLQISLLDRPRPPQFGSENLRIWYRVRNASGNAQVFLHVRQGLQSRKWPIAIHDDLEGAEIETTALVDVTEDFFAGQDVKMSLVVVDGRQRTASSRSHMALLPQKFFLHPFAREVARIRSGLINRQLTAEQAKVQIADLGEAAQNANLNVTIVTALRQSYWRLSHNASDPSIASLLWLIANHMEDSRRLTVLHVEKKLEQILSEKDQLLPVVQ
jgi:Domain of unknown function (DUF4175)